MKRLFVLIAVLTCLITPEAEAQMRGFPNAPRERSWRFGVEGGLAVLGGDLTKESEHYHYKPYGNLELAWLLHRNFAVGLYGGAGQLRSTSGNMASDAVFLGGGLLLELRLPMFRGSFFPLLQLRGGGLLLSPELRVDQDSYELDNIRHMSYGVAAGFEAVSWRRLGIRALVGVQYTTTDNLDYLLRGDDNDAFSYGTVGLLYYFGGGRR